MVFVGCSPKSDQELYYEVQKKVNKIDSYHSKVEITSVGNKGAQVYTMNQWFKKPDKYKIEIILPENLKGKTTVSDGNKAWIYNPNIEQTCIMENFTNSEEQNSFLGYFLKNLLNSENVDLLSKVIDEDEYLIISTDIPGNHAYYNKEELYVNIDNMKPYLLKVYDAKDQLRIEVKYIEFEYNPTLENSVFQISELN